MEESAAESEESKEDELISIDVNDGESMKARMGKKEEFVNHALEAEIDEKKNMSQCCNSGKRLPCLDDSLTILSNMEGQMWD